MKSMNSAQTNAGPSLKRLSSLVLRVIESTKLEESLIERLVIAAQQGERDVAWEITTELCDTRTSRSALR